MKRNNMSTFIVKKVHEIKNMKLLGFIMMICIISAGIFMQSCNQYDILDNVPENSKNAADLEVADFKNWFKSQDVSSEFVGTQEPDWDNAEFKAVPKDNRSYVSIEIYKGKNAKGNDSIINLQIAYVDNIFMGGTKVFSFYDHENANIQCYSLTGEILEEGMYYAPKQIFMLLKRHNVGYSPVRLKNGTETTDDPCEGTERQEGTATPLLINGKANKEAQNCHYYVWGSKSTCPNATFPKWNDCPDIANSGVIQVSTPQVGDRWVSFERSAATNYDKGAIHSAFISKVTNGKVTELIAKDGQNERIIYNPDCKEFKGYLTNDIRYYRKK